MFDISTEIKLAALNMKFKSYELSSKVKSIGSSMKERRHRQNRYIKNGLKYTAEEYARSGIINPFKGAAKAFVDYCNDKDNS